MSIHSTPSYLWAVMYLWIVDQHHYSIKSEKYIQLCDNLQTIRNISIKSTSSLNPLYKQPSFQTQKSNWCLSGTIPAFSVTSYKQTTECSLLCLSFVTKLNAFEVQSCIHIATFCSFLLMNIFYMYIPQKCFNLFTSRWIFGLFPIQYDYDQRYYEHSQAKLCMHMFSFLLDKFQRVGILGHVVTVW